MSLDQGSYNKGGMVALVISMAVTFAVMFYVAFLNKGIDLKEVAEKAEADAQIAPQAQAEAPQPVDISAVKEPWMPSDEMVAAGKALFATNCKMCHGETGRGDGPASGGLARNLVEGKWKLGGTRMGLMKVLLEGIPGSSMQSYKHLPVNDRWALVHFIRSITENKVADDDKDVAAKAASIK